MTVTGVGESPVQRSYRQQLVWQSWLDKVKADPTLLPKVAPLGEGDGAIDISAVVKALTEGQVTAQPLPVIRIPLAKESWAADPSSMDELVSRILPFPSASYPGQRPRVRILDATQNRDLILKASSPIVSAGGQITIIGNADALRCDRHEDRVPRPVATGRGGEDRSSARQPAGREVDRPDRHVRRHRDARLGLHRVNATDLAIVAATAADDKGATDIVILDVTGILGICDTFVIASARNTRLVAAVSEEIEERLWLGHDIKPAATEGLDVRPLGAHRLRRRDRARVPRRGACLLPARAPVRRCDPGRVADRRGACRPRPVTVGAPRRPARADHSRSSRIRYQEARPCSHQRSGVVQHSSGARQIPSATQSANVSGSGGAQPLW